jgi:hypothetical protein
MSWITLDKKYIPILHPKTPLEKKESPSKNTSTTPIINNKPKNNPPTDEEQPLNTEGRKSKSSPRARTNSNRGTTDQQPINTPGRKSNGNGEPRTINARYAAILGNNSRLTTSSTNSLTVSPTSTAIPPRKTKSTGTGLTSSNKSTNKNNSSGKNLTLTNKSNSKSSHELLQPQTTSPQHSTTTTTNDIEPIVGADDVYIDHEKQQVSFEIQNPIIGNPTSSGDEIIEQQQQQQQLPQRKQSLLSRMQRKFSSSTTPTSPPPPLPSTTPILTINSTDEIIDKQQPEEDQTVLSTRVLDVVQRSRERRRTESNVMDDPENNTNEQNPKRITSSTSIPPPPPPRSSTEDDTLSNSNNIPPPPPPFPTDTDDEDNYDDITPPPSSPDKTFQNIVQSSTNKTIPITSTNTLVKSTSTSPTNSSEELLDDLIVEGIIRRHHWRNRMPTSNPHIFESLLLNTSPFGSRSLAVMNNKIIESIMENLYFGGLPRLRGKKLKFDKGDVVVVGVPRVGQTPVLRILDYLRTGTSSLGPEGKRRDLVLRAPWIEAPFGPLPPPVVMSNIQTNAPPSQPLPLPPNTKTKSTATNRLFKTYLAPHIVLGFDPVRHVPINFKMVCVLRDPLDIRLSWFRHVRRMYKKTIQNPLDAKSFDRYHSLEQFETLPYPTGDIIHFHSQYVKTYEDYIVEVIRAHNNNPSHVCIVFYEELINNVDRVTKRLQEFTGWGLKQPSLDVINRSIVEDSEHPLGGTRVGCSGQGTDYISKLGVKLIDELWSLRVEAPFIAWGKKYENYQDLYKQITDANFSTTGLAMRDLEPFSTNTSLSPIPQIGSAIINRASNLSSTIVKRSSNLGSEMVRRGSNLGSFMGSSSSNNNIASPTAATTGNNNNKLGFVQEDAVMSQDTADEDEDDDFDDDDDEDDDYGSFSTGKASRTNRSMRASSLLGLMSSIGGRKSSSSMVGNNNNNKSNNNHKAHSTLSLWSFSPTSSSATLNSTSRKNSMEVSQQQLNSSSNKSKSSNNQRLPRKKKKKSKKRIDPDETDEEEIG